MTSTHLDAIHAALVAPNPSAAQLISAATALGKLEVALLKAHVELSFYARNAADYASDMPEIVERASNYLSDDAGERAEQALAALGFECLPPSAEELATEGG